MQTTRWFHKWRLLSGSKLRYFPMNPDNELVCQTYRCGGAACQYTVSVCRSWRSDWTLRIEQAINASCWRWAGARRLWLPIFCQRLAALPRIENRRCWSTRAKALEKHQLSLRRIDTPF
jgi:hypothetical protein